MQVRASYPRATFARIKELPEEQRARALERLQPSTFAALASASRPSDWMDGRAHIDLDDRLLEELGRQGFERYCRDLVIQMLRWGLFLPILAGRLRRPAALLKAVPLAFQALFRHAGRVDVAGRAGRVVVRHRDPPAVIVQSQSWVDGFAATLLGMLDLCRVQGNVVGALEGTDVILEVRW